MQRKLTAEERQILLENPELVMFHTGNYKGDFVPGIMPFLITGLVAVLGPIPLCFTTFAESHEGLIISLSLLWVILVIAVSVPLNMRYFEWRDNKDRGKYSIKILRKTLPEELVCNAVTIEYIVPQQAEGAYIEDGKRKLFGFLSYMNLFEMTEDMKVVIVYGDPNFHAFIKRAPQTERLYEAFLQEGVNNVV